MSDRTGAVWASRGVRTESAIASQRTTRDASSWEASLLLRATLGG
jgi:hypothetical protein